jgi:Domain of unknown function (DUF4276)
LTVRIAILVEGATERAFREILRAFLRERLADRMPKLDFMLQEGRLPKEDRLKRLVRRLLADYDAVIALTDAYTGSRPHDFKNAADAKKKMRRWVGAEDRFYPHAAQYDFEAWLLPYWARIQQLSGSNRQPLSLHPETIDHDKPPAKQLVEIFRAGTKKRAYSKVRDATAILAGQDLLVAAGQCPELRDFLNTILRLASGQAV